MNFDGDYRAAAITKRNVNRQFYKLYFKSLVSVTPVSVTRLEVKICDQEDNLVFKSNEPLRHHYMMTTSLEEADVRALLRGLEEATKLGIMRITIYCRLPQIFKYLRGIAYPMENKIAMLIVDVKVMRNRFLSCNLVEIFNEDTKFFYRPFMMKRCTEEMKSFTQEKRRFTQENKIFTVEKKSFTVEKKNSYMEENKNGFMEEKKNSFMEENKNSFTEEKKNSFMEEICNICFDDIDIYLMFPACVQGHRFCLTCVKAHVEVKLLERKIPTCPQYLCNSQLSMDDCGEILTEKQSLMWKLMIKEVSMPHSQRVYCPYQKCSYLMSKTELSSSFAEPGRRKCFSCGGDFCINCKVPWHSKLTCGYYKMLQTENDDAKLKSLANHKRWRQCDNCQHMVERTSGCDTINCRCGYSFSYTNEAKPIHLTEFNEVVGPPGGEIITGFIVLLMFIYLMVVLLAVLFS